MIFPKIVPYLRTNESFVPHPPLFVFRIFTQFLSKDVIVVCLLKTKWLFTRQVFFTRQLLPRHNLSFFVEDLEMNKAKN